MKKLKWIVMIVIIALIFVSGIYTAKNFDLFQTNKTSTASLVQDNIVELSELATLEYNYSSVIVSRTESNLPFSEAIKIITYSGSLKAGTDLSDAEISIDEASNKILVRVPKSKILDNGVTTEKTKVEDVKGNLFSDYPTQLVIDEINADKKKIEDEKIDQGFLDQADQRVKQVLKSFLKVQGYETIEIELF